MTSAAILRPAISISLMSKKRNQRISLMAFEGILEIDFQGACFDYTWLILMMSLTCTQADNFPVCYYFPGSSRVHLCGRRQGTEGPSTLRLHFQHWLTLISKSCSEMYSFYFSFFRVWQVWWVRKVWPECLGCLDFLAPQDSENQAYL